MGANMVRRLLKNGQTCVVFDRSPNAVKDLVKEKAIGACVYRKPYPGLLSEKSAKLAR
jgi:6-phosphogluconate dehydrogenase (decarboxylating)